jgi:hypothetical protein
MGSKQKAPPPPDYSEIAKASAESAKYSFELGKEQLAWAKEQYGKDSALVGKVVDAAMLRMDENDKAAAADRARYEEKYQPLEDQAIKEAQDYATPARQEQEAGKAAATVAQQFDAARTAATANLESFGVDPSSTRYAALDLGSRVQQAAAAAGAANNARTQTEAMGRAMRSEAINVGRGYPGQIAGTYGTAMQSGNAATNSTLASTQTGAGTMGTGTQWQGMGNGALAGWGNTLNMGYNNQMQQFNANQQSSSGIGSLLGAGLGMAMAFEEGGAVPMGQGAIPTGATSGGSIPAMASRSGGAATDDVDAKLNVGEFVIPTDVTSWLGEKHFQQMIEKSRKEKQGATAKPELAIAPKGPATFASRPQQSALPIG